jgi:glycosyltransferase involved in cell wall biosynthesis
MNIVFLTTHLNTGGITSYLFTLGRGLVESGHRVFIVSSGGDMEEKFKKAKIHLLNLDMRTKSELSPKLYRHLTEIRQFLLAHDIHLIHSQTRVTQVMGRVLQRLTKRPYVSTCHGFFQRRLGRQIFPCWGDRVIAISEPVAHHLRRDFQVSADRVRMIRNGIDVAAFQGITDDYKSTSRKKYHVEAGPVIGIVARLSSVKGQDLLIKAFKDVVEVFSNAHLLLVGEGRMESDLKRIVTQLGLRPRVTFIPDYRCLKEVLSLLDVFVMPSRQEGLGLSVMEAQAAGLPVIASRVGGLPSLIDHCRTGILVSPGDIQGLSQTLIDLLKDPSQMKRIGFDAQQMAERQYGYQNMVTKTIEVYQEILH